MVYNKAMRKVIFLDIDGVLNNSVHADATEKVNGCIGINYANLSCLKELITATDAEVVLTSTWKTDYRAQNDLGIYLKTTLNQNGIFIADCTKDKVYNRGHGIVKYLTEHEDIMAFVILDDDLFDDYIELNLLGKLVKTNYSSGLTTEKVREAIELLHKSPIMEEERYDC